MAAEEEDQALQVAIERSRRDAPPLGAFSLDAEESAVQAARLASWKEEREKQRRLEPGGSLENAIAL